MWEFWKDRCYRTIKNCYPDVPFDRRGTHHNALDDARSQALHLIAINEKYNIL
jgi:exodeoxyribonuclease VIII